MADMVTAVSRLSAWMTLGRLTIFSDCSLSTSLAHLSTTVLGQAFVCAAAATLGSSWASRDGKTCREVGAAFQPFHDPSAPPRTETEPLSPWPLLGVPGFGQVIVFWEGRHPSQSSRHSPAASRPSRQIGTLAISTCLPPQSPLEVSGPRRDYTNTSWQGVPTPIDAHYPVVKIVLGLERHLYNCLG